jgi:putative FmdB family regulatory protein
MPTYQYQCETCGIIFERKQHFTDEPLKRCPECSGQVHRVIHPVGVIFKGSGFYVTDNRKASSSTLPPKRDNSDKDTKVEDSKPATKTNPESTSSGESSAAED